FVARNGGLVAYFGAVGVYGVGRIMQEIGNLGAVCNTQSDQRKNPEFGTQYLMGFYGQLLAFLEERIEILHEIGVKLQKNVVERRVELFDFAVNHGPRF